MNNVFEGNFVGTDVTGKKPLPNAYSGVRVDSTGNNTIGGTVPGAGNVISNNGQFGIFVVNSSPGTVIQGNLIGTDITGTQPLGNVSDGIVLATSATDETVGGATAGAGNTIAYNGGNAVTIGETATDASTGNAVLGNSIFSNTGLGIDLGNNSGVTLNNSLGHTGPNNYQNFPVLTSVTPGTSGTTIAGSLNSTANTKYTIQFFANAAADPSGYGEGKTYLGQTIVTTDAAGNASFSAVVSAAPSGQSIFSATATDPAGNTSEFSKAIAVQVASSLSVGSTSSPSTYGKSVTFTATVSDSSGGVPTGSVEFYDGTNDLGPGTALIGSGTSATSTLNIAKLAAGTHSIRAVYTPTGVFAGSTGTLTQTVNQAVLTVSGITALNKVYIANTTATLNTSGAKLLGVVSGDTVNLGTSSATGTFASQNVGSGIAVAVAGLTISGAQASDYTLTEPTATANITPAALSITAVTNTKSYDGTTSAAGIPIYQVANEPVNTLYGSDRLTNLTETYDNPNAGTGKTLSVLTDTISDANNYAVTLVANKTGVITAASATATFVKTDTKTEGNWIGTYGAGLQHRQRTDKRPELCNGHSPGPIELYLVDDVNSAPGSCDPQQLQSRGRCLVREQQFHDQLESDRRQCA